MNGEYISRSLTFHGQPLQKIWEDERGAGDLRKWGVDPLTNDYSVYLERQKFFTFQDRAKRLKLHQFFSRKAVDLYDAKLKVGYKTSSDYERLAKLNYARPYIAALPPFEIFVNKNQEKFKRLRCLLEGLSPGDVVYGVVIKCYQMQAVSQQLVVKPLCTAEPLVRYLGDVTIKGAVQRQCIEKALDKRGNPRNFIANDFVCCEIVDVSVDADRLNLTMKSNFSKNKNVKLGIVSAEELPEYYRTANNNALEKYNDCLQKTKEFLNPNYDVLYELLDMDVNDTFTLMHKLKHPFPQQEYAKELRQAQASKWAFRSVAEGIEHFKIGRHVEAFQCLNKALSIDPRNVEGLVARGALYANKGSFLKAVDDFEKALKLNSFHVNARKYMGETLVALGRSYEEDHRLEEAVKAYRDCINIIPNHEQARLSLEALQQRPESQLFDNLLNIPGSVNIDLAIKQKKNKTNKSTTCNPSSGSDSSGSESDTDSDSSENLRSVVKKDISLSPLSKRMALSASSGNASVPSGRNQFGQPFYLANQTSTESNNMEYRANEFRLDDDDTESRVRKLLQDASKYKKQKTKKSKKKKSKKSKKENRKDKTASLPGNLNKIHLRDALQCSAKDNDAVELENELADNLQLYEQSIAKIKEHKALEQSTSVKRSIRSDTPPPKAPSMNIDEEQAPPPPPIITASSSTSTSRFLSANKEEAPRFSFTIKRPVKVDKLGMVRIATPLVALNKRSISRSRSTSRGTRSRRSSSRGRRSQGRSGRNYRRHSLSRSRSRSLSWDRRRSRRSRSRSRGRYLRSRSRSVRRRTKGRRRTPSPFVPRATPPPKRRSRSPARVKIHKQSSQKNFGNRVWQRPGYKPSESSTADRWEHDKFISDNNDIKKADDGPTIEEIDEIINKAQKERKEEIIKRDKGLLKKNI